MFVETTSGLVRVTEFASARNIIPTAVSPSIAPLLVSLEYWTHHEMFWVQILEQLVDCLVEQPDRL